MSQDIALQVKNLRVSYMTGEQAGQGGRRCHVFALPRRAAWASSANPARARRRWRMALMRLHKPPAYIMGGEAILDGRDILALEREQMRQHALEQAVADPAGVDELAQSGDQDQASDGGCDRGARARLDARADQAKHIGELLGRVGLPDSVAEMYPHELSGGMKQRVCIALAIILEPSVIIADEPTSALDVVVQRVVMQTLNDVQEQLNAAMIIIGHDMGLMAQSADRLAVMYAGKMVEVSPIDVFLQRSAAPIQQAADQFAAIAGRET